MYWWTNTTIWRINSSRSEICITYKIRMSFQCRLSTNNFTPIIQSNLRKSNRPSLFHAIRCTVPSKKLDLYYTKEKYGIWLSISVTRVPFPLLALLLETSSRRNYRSPSPSRPPFETSRGVIKSCLCELWLLFSDFSPPRGRM